jgi:hypothetical protein
MPTRRRLKILPKRPRRQIANLKQKAMPKRVGNQSVRNKNSSLSYQQNK